ncbi:MAG: ABC transporter permease [Armatimonadetes bacterium]|nr:ABC transporter permease [Armatimonadota bacterium]
MSEHLTEGTHLPALSPSSSRLARWMNGAGVCAVVAFLATLGALVSGEFLSLDNLLNTLRAVGLLGIVAVGVAFVTYSGHYADLSVPAIMAFSGIVAVSCLKFGIVGSLLAGMLAGLSVGALNGLAIGCLRVNPIIWTLAAASCMDGFMRRAYSGKQVCPDAATPAGQVFLNLYGADLPGGIPFIIVIPAVLVLAGYILMGKTGCGVQLKLTGSAYRVARLTGVGVRRVVALAFWLSSLTASIGGILPKHIIAKADVDKYMPAQW